jgi:hypothetical protein
MRLFEITDSNMFAADMYDIELNLDYSFDLASQLFNDIMVKKNVRYTQSQLPYFQNVKDYIMYTIQTIIDNFPDQNDSDLIKLIAGAKRMIVELNNMQQAMRDAKLIK